MILTLDIVSPDPSSLGTAGRQSFGSEGGIIGRARTSDWVLPNSKVSSKHAVVTCVNGAFYLEDTSTNGVYLNQSRERLVRGRPRALRSGDRLVIEPYEIRVTIGGAARADERASDGGLFGSDDPFASAPLGHHTPSAALDADEARAHGEVDPLKLLGGEAPKAPPRKVPTARGLDAESPLAGHYRPPAVLTPPVPRSARAPVLHIPEDYDPLASDSGTFAAPMPAPPEPEPEPERRSRADDPFADAGAATPDPADPFFAVPAVPAVPAELPLADPRPAAPRDTPPAAVPAAARPAAGGASGAKARVVTAGPPEPPEPPEPRVAVAGEGLAAMLAGAGLEGVDVTDELARDFGRILKVVVTGVMDVLRARQQIKDEFRMRVTQFRPADNNPLKFSANVDDALHNLLVKRNAAYLPAVDAFEDAFDDLRAHQIAMLAGMRVAFEAMFAQFEPDRLQQQFDRQLKKGSLLSVPAKLRYWELYRERCETLLADPETSFKKLFGEEFARAYEDQLARLKAEHRSGQTPKP